MGNFKHQSLRSGDRDRERDGDRDREIRDKEGLRHVGPPFFLQSSLLLLELHL